MAKKPTKKELDLAYEQGKSLISDTEYDSRYKNESALIIPKNTPWAKVKLPVPMRSLNKLAIINVHNRPNLTALSKWTKPNKEYIMWPKYDGVSILLNYENGKLVNALTRGTGEVGEDVTRNIVKVQNLPTKIDKNITALIGEVIIPLDIFKKHLAKEYANPRNATAGILKDFEGENAQYLEIRYYNAQSKKKYTKSSDVFESVTVNHLEYKICKGFEEIEEYYYKFLEGRDAKNYLCDGMVIKINSINEQEELGFDRDGKGNPLWACAVKFPYIQKETILEDIEWSMGKSGTINPVAIVQEVDLGVKVKRASLHNLDNIIKLWGKNTPRKGDTVLVSRCGDVIPGIDRVIENNKKGELLKKPTKCPTCSSKTVVIGPFLECSNADCDSRRLGDLYKWSDKIKECFQVKGLGPERIDEMFATGLIKTPIDLYKVKEEDLIKNLSNVKKASAKNILEFQKHREIPLDVFLSGLNFPDIGQSIFGFLIKAGFNTLEKIQKAKVSDLVCIQNLGEIRADIIQKWMIIKEDIIKGLLKELTIKQPEKKKEGSLSGKSVCFTGKISRPRNEFEKLVTDNGGEIKSVSKNLDFLVVGEDAGSKLAKAKSLGITILSEEELMAMI